MIGGCDCDVYGDGDCAEGLLILPKVTLAAMVAAQMMMVALRLV